MLKRLLIAVVAAAVVAGILVAVHYQQRNAVGKGYDIKCTQDSPPSSASAYLTCKINPEQDADQSKPKPPWWDVLLAWPEGITAWLLLLTLGAIVWQSNETKKAARAALLNAQAVINAERAWLVISGAPLNGPAGGFTLHCKNKGRTPAMLIESSAGCVAVKKGDLDFSREPEYGTTKPIKDRLLVNDESVWVFWFDRKVIRNMLRDETAFKETLDGERKIFFFWRIVYRDMLNPAPANRHETCWGCFYELTDEGDQIYDLEGTGVLHLYSKYS